MMNHLLRCHDILKTDFVRGQNCDLYDAQGRRYVDLESGCWCAALGYGHPRLNEVMKAQIEQVIHLGTRFPNTLAEEAAVEVLGITGVGDGKCIFLSSGSEAVEFGVQAARRVTGRPRMLTFASSYLAAFGSAGRKDPSEWRLLDWQQCDGAAPGTGLQEIPFAELGGFVFEPGGSGSESVRFPSVRLVQELVRRVRAAGGVLVANEITAGMGRTGRWFGFQHYDVQPDIVAVGKGLGNGYPVSAVAMKRELADQLEAGGLHYAQSHQNDPLGCAVAKEVITLMRDGHWIETGRATGEFLLEGMQRLAAKHDAVREARGRGMLLALEFRPQAGVSAATVAQALFDHGYLVAHSPARNFLRLDPPLTLGKEEAVRFLHCLDSILESAGDAGAN